MAFRVKEWEENGCMIIRKIKYRKRIAATISERTGEKPFVKKLCSIPNSVMYSLWVKRMSVPSCCL